MQIAESSQNVRISYWSVFQAHVSFYGRYTKNRAVFPRPVPSGSVMVSPLGIDSIL